VRMEWVFFEKFETAGTKGDDVKPRVVILDPKEDLEVAVQCVAPRYAKALPSHVSM